MKRLSKIKSGALSRGLAIAKLSVGAGVRAASHVIGNALANDENRAESLKKLLLSQAHALTDELGILKGSLMKAGQMLSVVGENLLPPEVNAVLKSLQSKSPPLKWQAIEPVLHKSLSSELRSELEIDQEPYASASLGQVHLATLKADGKKIALKIQYPGVADSVDSDVRALRRLLSITRFLPSQHNYDPIFAEVREMLEQEVDYEQELKTTIAFGQLVAGDPRYLVPETFPRYSSRLILATEYIEGVRLDGAEVRALPQIRRNQLAEAALELYFQEVFKFRKVQTDPHFGNYRVQLSDSRDRLVLLDFGAVRELSNDFILGYATMIDGAVRRDRAALLKGGMAMGLMKSEDASDLTLAFFEFCELVTEPFQGSYDWGSSDLPKRVITSGKRLAAMAGFRPPPREIVFLDRKISGVFVMLSELRAQINAREILYRNLPKLKT